LENNNILPMLNAQAAVEAWDAENLNIAKCDGRRFCSKVVAGVEYRGLHRGNLQKEIAHSLGSRIGW